MKSFPRSFSDVVDENPNGLERILRCGGTNVKISAVIKTCVVEAEPFAFVFVDISIPLNSIHIIL